jgi:pimeloyl-ACP methyl ester carboxylesterase
VAFAPAGGWGRGDDAFRSLLALQAALHEEVTAAAPFAESLVSTLAGRRRATRLITERFEHIPAELLAHQILGIAGCSGARALLDHGAREGWDLDAERITCPVRIVWGTADRLLPWPSAAVRYREDWLPNADWIELDGVGHCPQLDVPLEAAQLILGFTAG